MTTDVVALFSRWRKPIRQYLSRRPTIPDCDLDDICQETFLRILRYSDNEITTNPQGYIFRIASNVANEWCALHRVCKPHDDSWLDDLVDEERQPEREAERESECRCVEAAINKLPHRAGVILLMHINDGKTCKQIASELGITYRIVQRDLASAYSTLRMRLA